MNRLTEDNLYEVSLLSIYSLKIIGIKKAGY